jgi:type IV pilus assembly protein PilW
MSQHLSQKSSVGFSMVELLVALVLTAIVGGIAVQSFLSTRQNHRFQVDSTELQSSARYAIEFLSRSLRMSGYRGDSPIEWALGSLSGSDSPLTGSNNDADTNNLVKDGTDTIAVVFEGSSDSFVKDCFGQSVAAGVSASNLFAVSVNNELACSVDGGVSFTPIVDGVESMHVLYGVDSDDDLSANRYVSANHVANFDEVVSVRLALLLLSSEDSLTATTDVTTYTLLDQTVYGAGNFANDRRVRRQVSTTLRLRNRL